MTFTSPLPGAQPGFSSEKPAGTSILPQYCVVALPWGPQEAAPPHTYVAALLLEAGQRWWSGSAPGGFLEAQEGGEL